MFIDVYFEAFWIFWLALAIFIVALLILIFQVEIWSDTREKHLRVAVPEKKKAPEKKEKKKSWPPKEESG